MLLLGTEEARGKSRPSEKITTTNIVYDRWRAASTAGNPQPVCDAYSEGIEPNLFLFWNTFQFANKNENNWLTNFY